MKKTIASLQASPTAILKRLFSRFVRSSFPFPSPSDACHAGYWQLKESLREMRSVLWNGNFLLSTDIHARLSEKSLSQKQLWKLLLLQLLLSTLKHVLPLKDGERIPYLRLYMTFLMIYCCINDTITNCLERRPSFTLVKPTVKPH